MTRSYRNITFYMAYSKKPLIYLVPKYTKYFPFPVCFGAVLVLSLA